MKKNISLSRDIDRDIKIYTWGNKVRKTAPIDSQWNLNVCNISSYKPHGIDLRKEDGRNPKLQAKIARSKNYQWYMDIILGKINSGINILSLNCKKGRHRSVAMAELTGQELNLKGYRVTIVHLDL